MRFTILSGLLTHHEAHSRTPVNIFLWWLRNLVINGGSGGETDVVIMIVVVVLWVVLC